MAVSSAQQSDPWAAYQSMFRPQDVLLRFGDTRPFPERYQELRKYPPEKILPEKSLSEKILKDCYKRLQNTIQVFDITASPRSFGQKTLELFLNEFVHNIFWIVYSLPGSQGYIGNKDKVVENLSKAKAELMSALAKRKRRDGESDTQKKREYSANLYTYLRNYVNFLEQSRDYWGMSGTISRSSGSGNLRNKLVAPKSAIQQLHDTIEFSTGIALPSIRSHEQHLRSKIIAPLASIPGEIIKPGGNKEFIYSKDGVLNHLREAKIVLNLALDECDLIEKGEDRRELYLLLPRCTAFLRAAITYLN